MPQASAIIEPAKQENVLRAGTEIPLLMREELTTKKKMLRVGQRVQMEVASSITSNGVVVIPAARSYRGSDQTSKKGHVGQAVIGSKIIRRPPKGPPFACSAF